MASFVTLDLKSHNADRLHCPYRHYNILKAYRGFSCFMFEVAASWRYRTRLKSLVERLIKVDPRNTTQRCYACGSIVKKDLSVRVHECPYCGFSCDRDYNASRNILFAGMEQPVAPIEPKPLHHTSVMQVLAMTWEAAPLRTR